MADDPNAPRTVPRQTQGAANPDAQKNAEQQQKERRDRVLKEHDERKKQNEENQKKAVEVMEKSTPWPTQEVADKAKLGVLNEDEAQPPDNPEMPSLHEQRQERRDERKR